MFLLSRNAAIGWHAPGRPPPFRGRMRSAMCGTDAGVAGDHVSLLADAHPIFVVGPSRSGTTLTMNVLRRHPDIYISTETHYFDDLRPKMQGKHRSTMSVAERQTCEDYFLSIASVGYGRTTDPDASPMGRQDLRSAADRFGAGSDAYFAAFCVLQAAQHGKTRWGEKTPRHVFRIDDMLQCFPHAKIICLVRDPRAVVASYRDNAMQTHDPSSAHEQRWRSSYDLLIMSLLWRSTLNHASAAMSRSGSDRIRFLQYERLVSDPISCLRNVTDWLGVEFDEAMLDVDVRNSTYATSGSRTGISVNSLERWKDRLSQEEIVTIQSVCGRWMRQFSYDLETTRAAPVYLARSWARLPFSAARATLANRARSGPLLPYIWRRARGALAGPRTGLRR